MSFKPLRLKWKFTLVMVLLFTLTNVGFAEVLHSWVDKNGQRHISNVPKKYLNDDGTLNDSFYEKPNPYYKGLLVTPANSSAVKARLQKKLDTLSREIALKVFSKHMKMPRTLNAKYKEGTLEHNLQLNLKDGWIGKYFSNQPGYVYRFDIPTSNLLDNETNRLAIKAVITFAMGNKYLVPKTLSVRLNKGHCIGSIYRSLGTNGYTYYAIDFETAAGHISGVLVGKPKACKNY